jgi:hypothetical protein
MLNYFLLVYTKKLGHCVLMLLYLLKLSRSAGKQSSKCEKSKRATGDFYQLNQKFSRHMAGPKIEVGQKTSNYADITASLISDCDGSKSKDHKSSSKSQKAHTFPTQKLPKTPLPALSLKLHAVAVSRFTKSEVQKKRKRTAGKKFVSRQIFVSLFVYHLFFELQKRLLEKFPRALFQFFRKSLTTSKKPFVNSIFRITSNTGNPKNL